MPYIDMSREELNKVLDGAVRNIIDDTTNNIMDLIRARTDLKVNSDADDEIYSAIWNALANS